MPTREQHLARVDLAHEAPFAIGPLAVEPGYRRISREGRELILEPKVMRVLVALAKTPDMILTRDDLIKCCWDGRIVGDAAIDRAISLLRTALRDMAGDAVTLETIARVGYRIHSEGDHVMIPVRRAGNDPAGASGATRWRVGHGLALALAILVLVTGGWVLLRTVEAPVVVAVMPFRALTPGEEYFTAGLGQEIATQLAGEPDLRVAGRSSTEQFADSGASPRELRAALGVDYMLDGSVRRQGQKVRIDVSLIRTNDGISQWSRSFDGDRGDVLVMQRNIARAVLAGLHREVVNTGLDEAALSTNGELYSEYLAARTLLRERDRPKILQAKLLIEEVTRLDPGFAPAWAERAKAEAIQYFFDPAWSPEKQAAADRRAVSYANRAIKLAPQLAQGYAARALVQHQNGPEAVADLRRAVELDPDDAEAWYWLMGALRSGRRFAEALEASKKVAELDPYWVRAEAVAPFLWDMGEREEARAIEQRIVSFAPDPAQRQAAKARIAAWRGDWSGYIFHSNEAMKLGANREQKMIWGIGRNGRLARLGIPFKIVATPQPSIVVLLDALSGDLPTLERIVSSNNGDRGFWSAPVHPYILPRMLLNEGRAADLVQLYDGPFGSPEEMDRSLGFDLVHFAPELSVALRREGRAKEAYRLLELASERIAQVRAIGPVPGSFEERAARVHAAQGKRQQAIASLKRAVALGWPNNHYGDLGAWLLPPFATEPVYASIAGDPWVRQLDRQIQANLGKERAKVLKIKLFYPSQG